MQNLLQEVEKELHIPREKLIEEGLRRFLEIELSNLSIEIKRLGQRHGVDSFDSLWEKLDAGEVTEVECFDDLTKLEYLELEKEKVTRLLSKAVS